MITDRDVEKLKETFVTRDEFSSAVSEILELIKSSTDSVVERLELQITSLRKEIGGILTNHEGRIRELEKKDYS